MSGAYQFEKDGGGEQDYGIIDNADQKEIVSMITNASTLDVVAIMDAE